ncbi:MFS transporter (macronuclear) [Tetrahymena thermophila SB210]|uniref:MFS transporter n=1 Tax=Tetrahymena thermophila (strain SB210) TaxID=312017 RepID=I7M8B7_TETTS|nr:MFS transporter [Tetrahymena thermophila SB210]EAR97574.2 MFS transporter [Tetrahymena thermophila SB210]|eukprot:XP_001017819.2 MFS transporter [Tetrahymena thermophila SB210]
MKSLIINISLIFFQIAFLYAREIIFNPQPISSFSVSSIDKFTAFYQEVTEDNKWAFLSRIQGGICVISLEDIQQPTLVTIIKTKGAYDMKIRQNYLFVSDLEEGLIIFDIKDPSNPQKIYTLPTPMQSYSLTVTKDMKTLFLIGNGIVYCYNIQDIKNPVLLSKAGVSTPITNKIKLDETESLLAVSNHVAGLQIIDVRNKNNIKLRASQITASKVFDSLFMPGNSVVYAVDSYFGLYASPIQGILDIPMEKDDLFPLNLQIIYQSPLFIMSIDMTKIGDYFILGFRSVGLKLFKIVDQQYFSPQYIQDIDGGQMCYKLILSSNEKYLFASNGLSLVIYQSDQPQINKDFPNLFNNFQSNVVGGFKDPWPWEIFCFNDNKHVIIAGGTDSTFIFSIDNPYQPELITKIPSIEGAAYDGLTLLYDQQPQSILYLGLSQLGFYVYDISDLKNPIQKKHIIPSSVINDSDGVLVNRDNSILIIGNGSIGISVYNIKDDKFNPKLAGEFINTDQYKCTFEKCAVSKQSDYIFCACREQGVVIFSYQDQKVTPVSIIQRVGTEYPILSADETHLFTSAGFQGLVIADIQDKFNPKIVSTLTVDGQAQTIHFLPQFDQKYILVSQMEKGQLTVINIEDYSNPYIFSKVSNPHESSSSFCITPDNNSLYFIGDMGLRYIPIQTSLKIHTQISVLTVNSSGKSFYQLVTNGQKLKVGQNVQMVFVPLEVNRDIKFSQVFYYRNYENKNLPTWMNFLSNQKTIEITVDKEGALNTFSTEKNGENVLILEVFQEVLFSDFINEIINQKMANAIISTLRVKGVISTYNFLDTNFDPNQFDYLDFYNSDIVKDPNTDNKIQAYVKQILTFSKVSYPIRFFIESSLKFNYKTFKQENIDLFSTPSYQIIVYFSINQKAKFIRKTFEGVLASFSDDLSSLKIEGPSIKVNQIVSSQIQIANLTTNFDEIIFQGSVSDSSNYDINFEESFSVFQDFIYLNNPVTLNQSSLLQQQFNKAYSNGEASVESKFQFTFDINTFNDLDKQQLTYKAYIVTDSNSLPQEIVQVSNLWIEFNPQTLTFTGFKSISSFLSTERIKVVASDGFTEVSDQFTIYFNQLTFTYTMQLIFQIVGPIFGILGIWKYRSNIYQLFMQSYYLYSSDIVIVGELYKKQIVLFDDVQNHARQLWKNLNKQNKNLQSEIIFQYTQQNSINIQTIMQQMHQIFDQNHKIYSTLDPREFDFDDSRLSRTIRGYVLKILLDKDKFTTQLLKFLKKEGSKKYSKNDWYKNYIHIIPSYEANQFRIINKNGENTPLQSILRYKSEINKLSLNDNIQTLNNPQYEEKEAKNNIYKLRNNELDEDIQEYKNLNPFPQIIIKIDCLNEDIKKQNLKQYDNYLLQEFIISEALGIKNNFFQISPNKGESIIVYPHQINNITAYKKYNGCCLTLKKMLKDDYRKIELTINNPLPKWLNCEIIDGIIHIWGIPKAKDEPEIQIRIINEFLLPVYSFNILIKDKEGGDLRDKKYVKDKDLQKRRQKSETQQKEKHISCTNGSVNQGQDISPQNQNKDNKIQFTKSIFQNILKSNFSTKHLNQKDIEKQISVDFQFNDIYNNQDKQENKNACDIQINPSNHSILSIIPDENMLSNDFTVQSPKTLINQNLESKEQLYTQNKIRINQLYSIEDHIQILSQKKMSQNNQSKISRQQNSNE